MVFPEFTVGIFDVEEKKINKKYLFLLYGFILFMFWIAGCTNNAATSSSSSRIQNTLSPVITSFSPTSTLQESIIHSRNGIEIGGDGEPIELINNSNAINPTYSELLSFLNKDRTDEYSYIIGPPKVAYVCSDFARDVHNNAEKAGIRAAWVGIDIQGKSEGHAINAFQTTDVGLVFIDCTGKGLWEEKTTNINNWDRRAHVEIGKPYAVVGVDKAYEGYIYFTISIHDYLDESSKLAPGPKYLPRMQEIYDWAALHDVKKLGQQWMKDWLQKYGPELDQHGQIFDPVISGGGSSSYFTTSGTTVSFTSSQNWKMMISSLDPPQYLFSEQETRNIDGIPVFWDASGSFNLGLKPLGNVTDIQIHW